MPHKETGVGTDIFVRKVKPGTSVGEGYYVDIFNSGVKDQDESRTVRTKKQVIELIKEYKSMYNTDRSFQNEQQVHVTYKTKEERGETIAMSNLDSTLIKKATYIQGVLQRLLDPTSPIKVREGGVVDQTVSSFPETAIPGGEMEEPVSPDSVGKELAKEIVEFVASMAPQDGGEWVKNDEMYNPIVKWISAVQKKRHQWEKMANQKLEINKAVKIAYTILFSEDPAIIKQGTGLDVTPDIATKVNEISSLATKKQEKGEAPGKESNKGIAGVMVEPQGMPRAASKTLGTAEDRLLGDLKRRNEDDIETGAGEHAEKSKKKDDKYSIIDTMDKVVKNIDGKEKNYAQLAVENLTQDQPDKGETTDFFKDNRMAPEPKRISTELFWNYASNINKVATIEKTFEDWININDISVDVASKVWDSVKFDLVDGFGLRKEAKVADHDMTIYVLYTVDPELKLGARAVSGIKIPQGPDGIKGGQPIAYSDLSENPHFDISETINTILGDLENINIDQDPIHDSTPVEKKEDVNVLQKLGEIVTSSASSNPLILSLTETVIQYAGERSVSNEHSPHIQIMYNFREDMGGAVEGEKEVLYHLEGDTIVDGRDPTFTKDVTNKLYK